MTHSLQTSGLDNISLATQILGFSIVSPLVALRAFARFKLRHPFGIEDATCYMAWLLFVAHSICTIFYTYTGGTVSNAQGDDLETKYKVPPFQTPLIN